MKNWLIPHPNVSNAEFGDAHLKRVTTLFNENFAKLDALMQSAQSSVSSLESSKSNDGHNHDESYAQLEHKHVPDDVTGLSSLLDNKANLNHEHPQYLTEVTAHQHETNEVNGLIEALNGKAPTAHGHTFADVDGLDDLSTSAARIDYVDQRDTEKLAAAMAYTDAAVSGIVVPEASSLTPYKDSENGSSGSATSFARGDHRHPVNYPSGKPTTNIKRDGSGANATPLFGTTNNYADLGHSHPLNVPEGIEILVAKQAIALTIDGLGTDTNNGAALGSASFYARLDHIHGLNVASSGTPSDVVKNTGTASLGSNKTYARTDHVHKMPTLWSSDIKYTENNTVKNELDGLSNKFAAKNHNHNASYMRNDASHTSGGTAGSAAYLNVGVENGVQAYSAKITTLSNALNNDGTMPSSSVKDANCTSGGDCLAYFDATQKLAHLGNVGITVSRANSINKCFDHAGEGASMSSVLNCKAAGANAAPTSTKAIGFKGNSNTASLIDVPSVDPTASAIYDGTLMTYDGEKFVPDANIYAIADTDAVSGQSIVSMNNDGILSGECALPTTAQTNDKVLTIKANQTALSWENGVTMGTSTNPSYKSGANISTDSSGDAYLNPSGITAAALNLTSSTWTRGDKVSGSKVGAKITVCTGIKKHSSQAVYYAHFANLTFDENGMLYKVETVKNFYRV